MNDKIARLGDSELQSGGLGQGVVINNAKDMIEVAKFVTGSKLCPKAFHNDPASAFLVMAGASQLGLPWFVGLQKAYVIEGKISWAAEIVEALVQRSPRCKKCYPVEVTDKRAVYIVQTTDMEEPVKVTYTIEDAQAAGLLKKGGSWNTSRADMLCARARVRVGRRYFPEALQGIIFKEDIDDTPTKNDGGYKVEIASRPTTLDDALTSATDIPMPEPVMDIEDAWGEEEAGEIEGVEVVPFVPDLDAMRSAARMIGPHGPKLVASFVEQRFGIKASKESMLKLTEEQYLEVDEFIKDTLQASGEIEA